MSEKKNEVIIHKLDLKNYWIHCVCVVGFDLTEGHAMQEIYGNTLTQKEQMQMFNFSVYC